MKRYTVSDGRLRALSRAALMLLAACLLVASAQVLAAPAAAAIGTDDERVYDGAAMTMSAAEVSGDPVCVDSAAQYDPDIDGRYVVWQDTRNTDADIYLRNLNTGIERRISAAGIDEQPAISNGHVVYVTRDAKDQCSLQLYDIATNTTSTITSSLSLIQDPDIEVSETGKGTEYSVVWTQYEGYDTHINLKMWTGIGLAVVKQISTNPQSSKPQISGDHVVWHGTLGEPDCDINHEIYLYTISTATEQQLTTSYEMDMFPSIAGDRVVWMSTAWCEWFHTTVMGYTIGTGATTVIATPPPDTLYGHVLPMTDGNDVVWNELDDQSLYVYNWTSGATRRLTGPPAHVAWQTQPAIADGKVVWMDDRDGGDENDIYVADTAVPPVGGTPISLDPADQINPRVSGSVIVWQDNRNGNWDIYMKNLTTGVETRVSSTATDETNPDIDRDRIVYQFGVGDILLYNISTSATSTIVAVPGEQSMPRISNRWVVWQDKRSGSWDIYCYNLDTHMETLLTASGDQGDPEVDGNQVAWTNGTWGETEYTIVIHDLLTSTRTEIPSEPYYTPGYYHPANPDIGAGYVAYTAWNPGDQKVFYRPLDGGTPQQVNICGGDHDGGLTTANGRVAFSGGGGALNIYVYDMWNRTGTQVTAGTPDTQESHPAIDCNLVAWESTRNGNCDIYYEYVPGANPPFAGFTLAPASGPIPLTVQFTDTSEGATIWEWDFEYDGVTDSVDRNPTYTFRYGGYYEAYQLVRNCGGSYWDEQPVYAYSPVPGRIEAEDFNGNSDSWHDTTVGNAGGAYRQTGVDIEAGGSGYNVGYVAEGEWLKYEIAVATAGSYTFTFRAGAWQPGRTIDVYVDNALRATVATPQTAGSSAFADVSTVIPLATDDYEVKLVFHGTSQNLDYFTITPGSLPLLAVPGGGALPTDTDLDGRYEDINGNGRADFADVVLYFNQMSWIAANEPVTAFDYNGNGRIDFADVVWLFNNL